MGNVEHGAADHDTHALVQARPAVEVPAKGHHRVLRQLEANLEAVSGEVVHRTERPYVALERLCLQPYASLRQELDDTAAACAMPRTASAYTS